MSFSFIMHVGFADILRQIYLKLETTKTKKLTKTIIVHANLKWQGIPSFVAKSWR